MTAQVATDLRAAADVLRRDGWTQGGLSLDGRLCAAEALHAVTCPDLGRSSDSVAALRRLGISEAVSAWNDTPGRTADEVIAALEAAADAAEATP